MVATASIGPDDCAEYPTGRECGPLFYVSVVAYVLAGLAILATLGLLARLLFQRHRAHR